MTDYRFYSLFLYGQLKLEMLINLPPQNVIPKYQGTLPTYHECFLGSFFVCLLFFFYRGTYVILIHVLE